jgi:AGZA family xanthine/uracil permease-like MFS transporter
MLLGILSMAVSALIGGLVEIPSTPFSWPQSDYVFTIDVSGWTDVRSPDFFSCLVATSIMFFVLVFDLVGVQYGIARSAGLLVDDKIPNSKEIMMASGLGTMVAACLGCSPLIIANESMTAIVEGGRTGLVAVTVGVCFGLSVFFAPLIHTVPREAQGVPLTFVGAFMMSTCAHINWKDLRQSLPSFVCISLMPFTHSIDAGLIGGLLLDAVFSMVDWLRLYCSKSTSQVF